MSETRDQEKHPSGDKPVLKKEMSRRQFLTYALGGTGGFMAALPLIPMIRFAVDPILQSSGEGEWVKVVEVDKITTEPTEFSFSKLQVDGWYKSEPTFVAWIAKDEQGNIFALSPVCKHLGCTVNWNTKPEFPNEYFCPCHDARYSKDGKNITVAPAPLDEYDVKVENGYVYVGNLKANTRV